MTLASQGRSASALTGALSGSGTLTLQSRQYRRARPARLRHCDPLPAITGRRPTTPGCGGSSSGHCRPARCRSRRRRFHSISGMAGFASAQPRSMPKAPAPSYRGDMIIPADPGRHSRQSSLRQRGDPDQPSGGLFCSPWYAGRARSCTVDIASLSSWLAVRAIDRETRRLDAIERRRHVRHCRRPFRTAGSPAAAERPDALSGPGLPFSDTPLPSRGPRRPRATQGQRSASAACAPPNAPVVSQQLRAAAATDRIRPAPGCCAAAEEAAVVHRWC